MPRLLAFGWALALLLAACGDGGGGSEATPTTTASPAPSPTAVPQPEPSPTVSLPNAPPAGRISLPAGFSAYAIAEGFSRPTSIALAADGSVYISERHGNVFRLADRDGNGVFEQHARFASGFEEVTGLLATTGGTVYVSSRGRVTTVRDTDGDTTGDEEQEIISGLPHGRHQNNGLALGPDGKLYLTNGSTCDDCVEEDPLSAIILQAGPDGNGLRVYARGLRNPYDLVFDGAGRLWATDNGSDAPCATIDELNLIEDGGDYGWPYRDRGCDPYAAGTPPVADLGLHTASTGVAFYGASQFPLDYRGDLFATLWGSVVYTPELPPQLVRIVVNESAAGLSATVETFATGFANPIDVAVDRDGTLLVLDYGSGRLYRIVYRRLGLRARA